MEHNTPLAIPATKNNLIAISVILWNIFVLFGLPLWLLPISAWWGMLIPFSIWVHNAHWALIHESVHRLLSPNCERNESYGRLLGVLMGTSFQVLRFGHLMHHQYNREWESEMYDGKSKFIKNIGYYVNLLGGLYLMEVIITLMATLLPNTLIIRIIQGPMKRMSASAAAAAEQTFLRRGKIDQVRVDGTLIMVLYTMAVLVYGPYWPWLVAYISARALTISFFDNIYHYGTAPDNSEAASELSMPRLFSLLLLNGNYHETHHLKPSIPWNVLPQHQRRPFQQTFMEGALRQFKGPIIVTSKEPGPSISYPRFA